VPVAFLVFVLDGLRVSGHALLGGGGAGRGNGSEKTPLTM
jgi:hypothetical protein